MIPGYPEPMKCPACGGTNFGRRSCRGCGAVPDWMSRYRLIDGLLRKLRAAREPEGDLVQLVLAAYWAMTTGERWYAQTDLPLPPKRQSR